MLFPLTTEGGCHCGRVRFRATLREGVALACNCSICEKKGFLHVIVPKEDFTLLQGEADLTTYTFNTGVAKHTFCKHCGVQPFYTPRSHPHMMDVNARCLDGHVVRDLEIRPFDGENWEANVQSIR